MICIDLTSTDPCINLATEEYLLRNSEEDYFLTGINDRSVIIGKHQVAHREADTKFVTLNKIPVVRRISGGGAVYHDKGNINFSFIVRSAPGKQVDFRKYTTPVINFLFDEGINANLEGKSDLKINGYKISGNAEHVFRERVLHHGTILFDADIASLKNSLRKDRSCYLTRAVDSNPSDVMNLREITSKFSCSLELKERLFNFFIRQDGNKTASLTGEEIAQIRSLADSKYRTWEWNYAYGPEYEYAGRFETRSSGCSCRIFVKNGIIRNCVIEGMDELNAVCGKLTGCRHMPEALLQIFRNENILLSGFDIFRFF